MFDDRQEMTAHDLMVLKTELQKMWLFSDQKTVTIQENGNYCYVHAPEECKFWHSSVHIDVDKMTAVRHIFPTHSYQWPKDGEFKDITSVVPDEEWVLAQYREAFRHLYWKTWMALLHDLTVDKVAQTIGCSLERVSQTAKSMKLRVEPSQMKK